MWHSQSRLIRTGFRRNRSRAFNRRASFEALEDRRLLSATVSFTTDAESVNESAGAFAIAVTLSGGTPTISPFASGINEPGGLAFGPEGNLYVADGLDHTVDKVTPGGQVTTFASGFPGSDVFATPTDLAFNSAGDLFVADSSADTLFEVNPTGQVTTFSSGFDEPVSLAFDSAGNLYVANVGDGKVSKVTPAGQVTTFASGFDDPVSLAFDSAGNLYVGSGEIHTVDKVTPGGNISTFASPIYPDALKFDAAGNLYVADGGSTVSEVTPAGNVSTLVSGLDGPDGLAFDSAGNLYVSNFDGATVSEVSQGVVVPFTLGGTAVSGADFSGITPSPLMFGVGQTTVDITGTLFSDPGPTRTLAFSLGTPTAGAVLGTPSVNTLTINEPPEVQFKTSSETLDGGIGTFSIPVTITGTPDGAVSVPFTLGGSAVAGVAYSGVTASPLTFAIGQVTDYINGTLLSDPGPTHTLTLTLCTPTGGVGLGSPSVNTLTINEPPTVQFGTAGETVDVTVGTFSIHGPVTAGKFSIPVTVSGTPVGTPTVFPYASGFNAPDGLAVANDGDVYVADAGSDDVREVTPAGAVSIFASGFDDPDGLAFDSKGNLYVANLLNNTVSKVTPAGVVSTFASGFDDPVGLAFDAAGNLYVANLLDNTVSEVTPAGVVSTFAAGFSGPAGLAFDSAGNLYVANAGSNTVDVVPPGGGTPTTFASGFNWPDRLAFDSAGNLYVANEGSGAVIEVTPAGQVATFTTGFVRPEGLAFDSAGTLYVANAINNTVSQVAEGFSVPFTLGGTGFAAVDSVTASPLVFRIGQTTEDITGTLGDPNLSELLTLTLTLGTPSGGAVPGSPSVNTMTIIEPPVVGSPLPTPTSTPTPPVFAGEQRVFSHKGRRKQLVAFEFLFNGALNAGSAQSTRNYHATQKNGKKAKVLRVKSALYNPSNFSVTISVSGFNAGKATQATITGLEGSDGTAIPEIVSSL